MVLFVRGGRNTVDTRGMSQGFVFADQCSGRDVSDHEAVISFCDANEIGFVVVGPETPLVDGLVDDLEEAGIAAFGPSAYAAQLEGSKGFTK